MEDEYLDIDKFIEEGHIDKTMGVEIINMTSDNIEEIQEKLRDNKILMINIRKLKADGIAELEKSTKKIKKTVSAIDGDMKGLGDSWLLVCPEKVKIVKKSDTK